MFYWALTDLWCNTIGSFHQREPGSFVSVEHSGVRRAQISLSIEEDLLPSIFPIKTGLYCEYNGIPIFHGPIGQPQFLGADRKIVVPAIDPSEWLARGFFSAAVSWPSWVQENILWDVVSRRRVDFDNIHDVYLRRVVKGTVTPSNIQRTHEVEAGVNHWTPLPDLSGFLDGPEFELEPLPPDTYYPKESGSSEMCAAWARLNAAAALTGTKKPVASGGGVQASGTTLGRIGTRTVSRKSSDPATVNRGTDILDPEGAPKFEFGFGEDNAQDFQFTPDGALLTNYANVRGQTPTGGGAQPSGFSDHTGSRNEYGTWEGWESGSLTSDAACKARAQQLVAGYNQPPNSFVVVPAMEWMQKETGGPYGYPPQFLTDYAWGDSIVAEGQFGRIRQKVVGRVMKATVTEVDGHGNTKVELDCVPRVVAQGVS